MNAPPPPGPVVAGVDDPQLSFLESFDAGTSIAGDVLEIDASTWAIHGSIAFDGDVILAEYATECAARNTLAELDRFERTRHRTSNPADGESP